MPNYTLAQVNASDAEAILACADAAYANNLLTRSTYPPHRQHLTSPADLHAWKLSSITARLNANNASYIKAVSTDSGDGILGFAGYYHPEHFSSATTSANTINPSSSSNDEPSAPAFPACMDISIRENFLKCLDSQRQHKRGADSQFWYLAVVAVDPRFQHRGIGEALVKSVLERAEQDRLPVYAEAAPEGARLYGKLGFAEEGAFRLLDGAYCVRCFVKRF